MKPAMDRVRRKPDPLHTLNVTAVNLRFKANHVAQGLVPKRLRLFSSRPKELKAIHDEFSRDHDFFIAAVAGVQPSAVTQSHRTEVESELQAIVARFDRIRDGFDLVEHSVRKELQRSYLIGAENDQSCLVFKDGDKFTELCRQFADPGFRRGAGMSDDEFTHNIYGANGLLGRWFTPGQFCVPSDFVRENLLARAHDLRRAVAAHPQGMQGLAEDFRVQVILGLALEVHWLPDKPIDSAAVNLDSFARSIEDLLELAPDWTYVQQSTALDVIAEVEGAQIAAQRKNANMVYATVPGRIERTRLRAFDAVDRAKRVLYQLHIDVAQEIQPRRTAAFQKYQEHLR